MPPRQNEKRDIRPASPDPTVRGLLALPLVQILPLEAGNRPDGYGAVSYTHLTLPPILLV